MIYRTGTLNYQNKLGIVHTKSNETLIMNTIEILINSIIYTLKYSMYKDICKPVFVHKF